MENKYDVIFTSFINKRKKIRSAVVNRTDRPQEPHP